MGKRGNIVLVVVAIALVGVIVWQLAQPRDPEPAYKGKSLRAWLETYADGRATLSTDEGATARVPYGEAAYEEAVRHVGTYAIPTLLHMLSVSDSTLKLKLLDPGGRH